MAFRRVLIALDDSAAAAHAVDVGIDLASSLRAEVALVHVIDPSFASARETGISPAALLADADREARQLLAEFRARLAPLPVPALEFIRTGKPGHEMIKVANEWPADLIVIASHGRTGVSRLLLGSVAEAVVRHAPCPVLVVRAAG
jgi:universal stress protein A